MASGDIARNGWHAVPLDPSRLFKGQPYINKPGPLLVSDMAFPDGDPLVVKVRDHVKEKLPPQTFQHSMRVYFYTTAIVKQQFPEHAADLSPSTLALTCLLHDIGTAPELTSASRMSFEFHGAIKARELVLGLGGPQDQADAVAEAIIRHQDLGADGAITFLGQAIQLATIFDNVGEHPAVDAFAEVLHRDTREDVIRAFPRRGWLGCFAATVRDEVRRKPWCHTTHIPDFASKIEGNALMRPYE